MAANGNTGKGPSEGKAGKKAASASRAPDDPGKELDEGEEQAFPDKKLYDRQYLEFSRTNVLAWIKKAVFGSHVPCKFAPMTDEQWEKTTVGWKLHKFRTELLEKWTGGYDTVAVSRDESRVLLRCDGPISAETLDFIITVYVMPVFARVHHIADKELEEAGQNESVPNVCVEIDPTKAKPWQQPKIMRVELSDEDQASILKRTLLAAYTLKPELLKGAAAEAKKEEPGPSKKVRKQEEPVIDQMITNVYWGFCQSTYDLSWRDKVDPTKHSIKELQTVWRGTKVCILKKKKQGAVKEPEPDVIHLQAANFLPEIEYVGDESSDEEMPELEDITDENREETYAKVKAYREASGADSEVGEIRKWMHTNMGIMSSSRAFNKTWAQITGRDAFVPVEGPAGTSHELQDKLRQQQMAQVVREMKKSKK